MATQELEFFPDKYFLYEKIHTSFEKEALLKKKEKKGKKFNPRYVALYFNYVLWYKPGKGPNGAPHEKGVSAKGVIELEKIPDPYKVDNVTDKSYPEGTFVIPMENENYFFAAESFEHAQQWVKLIRGFREKIQAFPKRDSMENTNKTLAQCQLIFPENSFRLPGIVPPDQAEKWVQDMRKYRDEYKKWIPFVNSLTCYAEFNIGRTKGYAAWFTNKSKGVFEQISNSEEQVLKNWEDQIKNAVPEMEALTETCVYMEDFKPHIEKYEKVLSLVDVYNTCKRDFQMEDVEKFQDEKELIQGWIDKLKTYPYAKDVTMEEYESGDVAAAEDPNVRPWRYDRTSYTARWTTDDGETVEFTCKDHHFTFVNPIYGSVAWNNKSCFWMHPSCPFVIRFDYYASKGVFRQKMPSNNPNIKKKPGQKDPPALSDWQYADGTMRAVTVGQRSPEPEVPPVTEFVVEGNLPPPIVLLAGVFYKIRETMRQILGLSNVFVPTGLNPIF